jgi:hypothetical protein
MKVQLYVAAIPFLALAAFAQNPAPPASAAPAQDSKATNTAATPKQNSDPAAETKIAETKTKNYSGVLTDASCGTAGSSKTAAVGSGKAAPDATAASGAAAASKTAASDADRAAADQGQSCSVSASTTQFAVKLKDGQTVKLDDVGNLRAQEALKNKKNWSEAAASGKPINVSANGWLNGEQLVTMSIK